MFARENLKPFSIGAAATGAQHRRSTTNSSATSARRAPSQVARRYRPASSAGALCDRPHRPRSVRHRPALATTSASVTATYDIGQAIDHQRRLHDAPSRSDPACGPTARITSRFPPGTRSERLRLGRRSRTTTTGQGGRAGVSLGRPDGRRAHGEERPLPDRRGGRRDRRRARRAAPCVRRDGEPLARGGSSR